MTSPHIILSSTSASRAALLRKLRLSFSQVAPAVDETRLADESPWALVERLSIAKAEAGYRSSEEQYPGARLSIGSDQVCLCGENILGKPGTADRAETQLRQLSRQRLRFITGLALSNGDATDYTHDETIVTMRSLSDVEIRQYVTLEQPFQAAGSFHSEALGIALFESIETQDPNALVGLPLIALCRFLRQHKVNPLTIVPEPH